MKSPEQIFIDALDRVIEFHRNNQNDPHNISQAVMVALIEVREAYRLAFGDK